MSGQLHLALRLALGRTKPSRRRSVTVAAAAAVATAIVVLIIAASRADRAENPGRYVDGGMRRFLGLAGLLIGIQLVALVGVAARAVANARSRGLANLRLLGVSPARTRTIAALELVIIATVGGIVGGTGSVAVAGARLRAHLDPVTAGLCVLAVVASTTALAYPQERFGDLRRGTRVRRPSWWRMSPIVVALILSFDVHVTKFVGWAFSVVAVIVVATGVGVLLIVPIFVRLAGDAFLRYGRGGVSMVAGRRLQAHPASMNRVIIGLLLGLFVATGARFVVGAFESTPQYLGAATGIEQRQLVEARVATTDVPARLDVARAAADVTAVVDAAVLQGNCDVPGSGCADAYVMSCRDLLVLAPSATGCRDDVVTFVTTANVESIPAIDSVSLNDGGATIDLPVRPQPVVINEPALADGVFYVVPPDLPGVNAVALHAATHRVTVIGEPGRDLAERLVAGGFIEGPTSIWTVEDYEYVDSLRTTVAGLTLFILGIGLVAYAVATIDAIGRRRRTAVAMQLVGTPSGVLRRVQLIETAVPTVGGAILAIAAGTLAGTAYVGNDGRFPTSFIATVSCCAIIGGLVVATLAVTTANPKIEPSAIRRE